MKSELINSGRFAKLANTTKRTIIWYDKEGVLKPAHTDPKGYRFYRPEQILDFQVIALLRRLHFSIDEIKGYMKKEHNMQKLFQEKRSIVAEEIANLQHILATLDAYYTNLENNGTFVDPEVKDVAAFEIYYIHRKGAYAQIEGFGKTLQSYFETLAKDPVFLTIFLDPGYRPHASQMKIAVIKKDGMLVKENLPEEVFRETVPKYKALSYIHKGPGNLLSLLWQEVHMYAKKYGFKENTMLPFVDLEYYYYLPEKQDQLVFEIHYPIL